MDNVLGGLLKEHVISLLQFDKEKQVLTTTVDTCFSNLKELSKALKTRSKRVEDIS